jgi:beta-glucosidase
MENMRPSMFRERSGDACDSYHRYAEDFAIAARLGFNTYRLGIEWARIEAERRQLLQRRARPLCAHARGVPRAGTEAGRHLQPFHHALLVRDARRLRGGGRADLFARYCRKVAEHLGG